MNNEATAPASYLDCRRPPIREAMKLECLPLEEALASLEKKGYFTPPPRPWKLGFKDRGLGNGDYCVLDKFGDLVIEAPNIETAEFIIKAVNKMECV